MHSHHHRRGDWSGPVLVEGAFSFRLLPPIFYEMKNDHAIPLSPCAVAIILEKLIVTLLMTAWSDVNVSVDSLHCPVCCSQSREGFQGGQVGHGAKVGEAQLPGRQAMGTRRVGYACDGRGMGVKEGRHSFIKTVVVSSPFLCNPLCFVSPAPE